MLFPAPNNTMYAEKMGVVFKSRQFSVCIYDLLKVEGVSNLLCVLCINLCMNICVHVLASWMV